MFDSPSDSLGIYRILGRGVMMTEVLWRELIRFGRFLGSLLFAACMAAILFVLIGLALGNHMIIAFVGFVGWLYITTRSEGRA